MDKNKTISRRDFFKTMGAAGVTAAGLSACGKNGQEASAVEPTGEMTCRRLTGDRGALLGYGCMRWPMKAAPDGKITYKTTP